MAAISPERWRELSPRLDQLLDLDDHDRTTLLASWERQDPQLAAELAELLKQQAGLDQQGFMAGTALPTPPANAGAAGQRLGAYTLVRELGRGGMGEVWLAERTDGAYQGQVAIKFLQLGLAGRAAAERFAREGQALARLDQPHIARLLDAGVSGDKPAQPYLVLEYVDGLPIDRWLAQHNTPLQQRVALLADAAEAVAHAHARLILHRDLKPSNLLVRHDGTLKLLDFGIAKLLDEPADEGGDLTRRAGGAYTPAYAAPEQLQGQEVTTATDVYALGVLLYQLLGGGHPTAHEGQTTLQRLQSAVEAEPRRLSDAVRRRGGPQAARDARALRGDLDTIVERALKKNPADRYANAADLAADLRRSLAHEPIAARPDAWLYRTGRFVRRHRVAVAAAAVALAAVLGGAALAVVEAREARAQREQAEGLLEFMLGDLRQKLQPVGRLELLDAVGDQALAYYAAQDAARLDAQSLGRRARALHLIGEIAERRGQLDESARRFDEAARSTAELLARAPTDGQRLFDHAQSEFWVGFVARRRGQLAAAQQAFERYRDLATRLQQARPQQDAWRLEPGFAAQNLGIVLHDRGQLPDALAALRRARTVFEAEAPGRPAVQAELATNLGWLARVHEALGDYPAAALATQDKMARLRPADGGAARGNAAYQLAVARLEAARLLFWQGRLDTAEPEARQAVAELQAVADFDPDNQDWRAALALGRIGWAEVLAAAGQPAAAARQLQQAASTAAPLWAAAQDKPFWQVQLRARWLVALAALPADAGVAGAGAGAGAGAMQRLHDDLQALVQRVSALEAAGKQLERAHRRQVAAAQLVLGDLLAQRGDAAAAQAQWQQAAQRLQRIERDLHAVILRAHALQRLGQGQEARALADTASSSSYKHPQLALLQQRLGRP